MSDITQEDKKFSHKHTLLFLILGFVFTIIMEVCTSRLIHTIGFWEFVRQHKICVFIPHIVYFTGLLFLSLFIWYMYRFFCKSNLIFNLLLFGYFILSMWSIANYHYTNPISYVADILSNGILNGQRSNTKTVGGSYVK